MYYENRRFLNVLFARRFNLFIDFLKISSLFLQKEIDSKRASARKSMVSTGDRSAKIRTYNFPQGRVTDHRINLTLYRLDEILDGDLTETIEALKMEERKSLLAEV